MSTCLLAKRFHQDLIEYASIRNRILPHEEAILLKYEPIDYGKDARFFAQPLEIPRQIVLPKGYHRITSSNPLQRISSDPDSFYTIFNDKVAPPDNYLEFESSKDNILVLRRYFRRSDSTIFLSHILICEVHGTCNLENFVGFMNSIHKEAGKLQGDFMAVEPTIVASDYADLVKIFVERHNRYEIMAGRQPISAYTLATG